MAKANQEIRNRAKEKGVYYWEIGEKLGVCEATITRALRKELPPEKKSKLLHAIDIIAREKNEVGIE